jgi:hypothetical protein
MVKIQRPTCIFNRYSELHHAPGALDPLPGYVNVWCDVVGNAIYVGRAKPGWHSLYSGYDMRWTILDSIPGMSKRLVPSPQQPDRLRDALTLLCNR